MRKIFTRRHLAPQDGGKRRCLGSDSYRPWEGREPIQETCHERRSRVGGGQTGTGVLRYKGASSRSRIPRLVTQNAVGRSGALGSESFQRTCKELMRYALRPP